MEKKNKTKILIITILILITLTLLGVTYAYYRTRIIENPNEKSISVTSEKLEIVYSDGTGAITAENIEPGYTMTKTFSVENTGDGEVEYGVYLEEVINTYTRDDWKFEVTCTPSCAGTNGEMSYPKLSEMILKNTIPSGVTQNYTVNIKYAEKNEDQSADMGAILEGKFQIYSLEDVIDLEGTIANANDGDYVQINSIEKKSQIVDGKYRLPAVEVGTHTLRVMNKNNEEKGKTLLTIEKGTKGISGSTITMDDTSHSVTLNIIGIDESLKIEIEKILTETAGAGTIQYAILYDNIVKDPITIPGEAASIFDEKIFAISEDDDGTSYYFRGNVENNYVNYSGMCWRIVRVLGDGNIKLILADEDGECNANTYSQENSKSAYINDGETDNNGNFCGASGTIYADVPYNRIKDWANKTIKDSNNNVIREKNLDESRLVETIWCNDNTVGKTVDKQIEIGGEGDYYTFTDKYYSPSQRKKPTLKCDIIGIDGSTPNKINDTVGLITIDEFKFAGYADTATTDPNFATYLKTNASEYAWWTLSPYMFYSYTRHSHGQVYYITPQTYLSTTSGYVDDCVGHVAVRPAITIDGHAPYETDETSNYEHGTQQNPYIIK